MYDLYPRNRVNPRTPIHNNIVIFRDPPASQVHAGADTGWVSIMPPARWRAGGLFVRLTHAGDG